MTGAVVISWGAPVRGREEKGLEVFSRALAYYEGLAKQGRVHGHKEYFANTGNQSRISGFMIVEGRLDDLMKIHSEPDAVALLTEAATIVENFTVNYYGGGSDRAVQERVTSYVETLQKLGYM